MNGSLSAFASQRESKPGKLNPVLFWGLVLRLAQKVFDSLAVFLGVIADEMNFGRTAQLDSLGEFVANVSDRRAKTAERSLLLRFAAHHADENARVLEVRCHSNLGDGDQALNPRIF